MNEPIDTSMELALTTFERKVLADSEQELREGIPVCVKTARAAARIHDGHLYRETHRSFGEYVSEKFPDLLKLGVLAAMLTHGEIANDLLDAGMQENELPSSPTAFKALDSAGAKLAQAKLGETEETDFSSFSEQRRQQAVEVARLTREREGTITGAGVNRTLERLLPPSKTAEPVQIFQESVTHAKVRDSFLSPSPREDKEAPVSYKPPKEKSESTPTCLEFKLCLPDAVGNLTMLFRCERKEFVCRVSTEAVMETLQSMGWVFGKKDGAR